jgi:hypothetical protein
MSGAVSQPAPAADRPRGEPIPLPEHQALTTWLTGRGLAPALVLQALGATPGNQTRQDVSVNLRAVLRSLPKGP